MHSVSNMQTMRSASNCLLVKDDIGKSKPATRDIPQFGFAYGAPNKPDAVGVGGCKKFRLIN